MHVEGEAQHRRKETKHPSLDLAHLLAEVLTRHAGKAVAQSQPLTQSLVDIL